MRYGICEWSALAEGEALFARLKQVGLAGVQVSYRPGDFVGRMERYAALAERFGITLTSVGANIFCERPIFDFGGEEILRQRVEEICRGALLTEGKLFHVPAFGASTVRTEEQFLATAGALRTVCDIAASFGVVPAAENPFSLEENRRLFRLVDRENLRMYFDTQNPQTTPHPDAPAQAAAFASLIPEVHVKDCDAAGRSVAPGSGTTRCADTLSALIGGGYNGWLLLENDYSRAPDPEASMAADLAVLKGLTEELCRS